MTKSEPQERESAYDEDCRDEQDRRADEDWREERYAEEDKESD